MTPAHAIPDPADRILTDAVLLSQNVLKNKSLRNLSGRNKGVWYGRCTLSPRFRETPRSRYTNKTRL